MCVCVCVCVYVRVVMYNYGKRNNGIERKMIGIERNIFSKMRVNYIGARVIDCGRRKENLTKKDNLNERS